MNRNLGWRIIYVEIGHGVTREIVALYRDFTDYYCPSLVPSGHGIMHGNPFKTAILRDIGAEVFGQFVKWLYTQQLTDNKGEPASEYCLMQLWILGDRLNMQQLQEQCIDSIKGDGMDMDDPIRREVALKTLLYVYANTSKGSVLRDHLVEVWGEECGTWTMDIPVYSRQRWSWRSRSLLNDINVWAAGREYLMQSKRVEFTEEDVG